LFGDDLIYEIGRFLFDNIQSLKQTLQPPTRLGFECWEI